MVIKDLLPRQVVCNQKDGRGKPCHGKLKRYYPLATYFHETDPSRLQEITQELGQNRKLVLLRCETCLALYHVPEELKSQVS